MGHLHGSAALAKNNGTLLGGDARRGATGERANLFANWILNVTADEAPKARTRIFTRALSFNWDIFNYFCMSHEQQLPYVRLFFYRVVAQSKLGHFK